MLVVGDAVLGQEVVRDRTGHAAEPGPWPAAVDSGTASQPARASTAGTAVKYAWAYATVLGLAPKVSVWRARLFVNNIGELPALRQEENHRAAASTKPNTREVGAGLLPAQQTSSAISVGPGEEERRVLCEHSRR